MAFTYRRVVTGHDGDGKAIVRIDEQVPSDPRGPGYEAKVVWCTSQFPPTNDEDRFDDGAPGPKGERVLFRVGEFLPGESDVPSMHRTQTQDLAIVLSGELDMVLDSGEIVERLRSGDCVVQRGTMHSWVARGTEPVRVLFVLMDAEPVRVGGQLLEEDLSVFGGSLSPMPAE
jgi:mannose-6-phosphate isomerase-like protein (cupin superfamily)